MTETLVTNPEQSEAFDQQFNRIVQTLGLLPADVRAEVLDFPAQREAVLKARRGLNRQQRAVLRTLDILSRMAVLDTEVVSVNLENISVTEASAAGTSRRSNENTILKDIPNTSRPVCLGLNIYS